MTAEYRKAWISTLREDRFQMLEGAKVILPEFRITGCQTGDVRRFGSDKDQRMTCNSCWVCPICAATHASRNDQFLRPLAEPYLAQGGGAYFLTMTVQHSSRMKLAAQIEAFMQARKYMHQQYSYRSLVSEATRIGSIHSLEMTHGRSGWHVHSHNLGFLEFPFKKWGRGPGTGRVKFEKRYLALWRAAARCVGLQAGPLSLHLKPLTESDFGDGWDAVSELTFSYLKAAQPPSRSPMQLLHAATLGGDQEAARLYRDFALATKGRNKLVWSDGLRNRLEQGALGRNLTPGQESGAACHG